MALQAIYLLMEKLSEIVLENSFTITLNYQLDQKLLANNFAIILNALKHLQAAQHKTDSQLQDLAAVKDRLDQLAHKVDRNTSNNTGNLTQGGDHTSS